MKAAVIGIGSELTSGQIVNRNAAWISQNLKNFGVETNLHLTVPDEKSLMLKALHIAEADSNVIFVTGGLGPTSDDFTRNVVAEWAGLPMHFDEASWKMIEERLTSRGYQVKEIQKQQCYFPQGSTLLWNNQGTANGFSLTKGKTTVFVLPGPPREVASCWHNGIEPWLKEISSQLDPIITRSWDTMGMGESDVALLVEAAVKNHSALRSDFEIGYRVHLPYVEVKISFQQSLTAKLQSLYKEVDSALSAITMARDGQDPLRALSAQLSAFSSFCVEDDVSGSFLMSRMQEALRVSLAKSQVEWRNYISLDAPVSDLQLSLEYLSENEAQISMHQHGQWRRLRVSTPHKTANMQERRLQYFAELAIIYWSQWLRTT